MKAYAKVKVKLHSFLKSVLQGMTLWIRTLIIARQRKVAPTHTAGRMNPREVLGLQENRNMSNIFFDTQPRFLRHASLSKVTTPTELSPLPE